MMEHVEHPYCIRDRFETDDDSNDVEILMDDEPKPFKITMEEYRRRCLNNEITIPRECDEIIFRNLLIKRVSRRPHFWWDEPDTDEGVCHNGEWIWIAMEIYERSGWLYECDYLVHVWKQLRDAYRLELIKIAELRISPQDEERKVTWIYFKLMSFLRHDMQLQIKNGAAVRNRREELRKRLLPNEDQSTSTLLDITSMREPGVKKPVGDQTHEQANYEKDANYIYAEVLRILKTCSNDAEKLTDKKKKILNFLWTL